MAISVRDLLVRYPGYRHRPLIGYACAVVLIAAGLGSRMVVNDLIAGAPYITFFPIVILATFVGGRGPGLLAVMLGAVGAYYFLIPPTNTFGMKDPSYVVTVIVYVIVAAIVVLLMAWLIEIAEQNAVLAQRTEALLTELQHRVKNHIQIVASLLNLQARRADPKTGTALTDVARRINMISSAYSHLYQADMTIDFAHHLHDIADAALTTGRTQRSIDVVAEPMKWGMDFVMPVSLIASELIDNALRHGLASGEGRVEVRLAREGENYVLRVSDTGGRLPTDFDVQKNASLGLQLATAMGRKIRATFRTEREPRTTFVVTFPAAN